MAVAYRPWGLLPWLLQRGPQRRWSLLACLGTEERSITAFRTLASAAQLRNALLVRVNDPPSRHTARSQQKLTDRAAEVAAIAFSTTVINDLDLLTSHQDILNMADSFFAASGESVVLDVSSFPKRFFFPFLKLLLKRPSIKDLVVTYTIPSSYPYENLAENYDEWAHLPLFSGLHAPAESKMMIVNVGFAPMGLQEEIDQREPSLPVQLLLPFPAAPNAVRRSWQFVQRLQKRKSPDLFNIYRTDAKDISDAFDRLVTLTDKGNQDAVIAPFGPKPISVAMCIFATIANAEVYYTQPTVYHPDYTIGVAQKGGHPEVYGYLLRVDGRDLYTM